MNLYEILEFLPDNIDHLTITRQNEEKVGVSFITQNNKRYAYLFQIKPLTLLSTYMYDERNNDD